MLVLLLAYSLTHSSFGEAGPISSFEGRDISSGGERDNKRALWTITWSCLTTIFLCTWVAVHPNVAFRPEKRAMGWSEKWIWDPFRDFLSYKLLLFLWALFVPEYILAWSIRQYIQANAIQKQVNGWTRTHGFFMIMGGFHLFRLPDGASSVPIPLKSALPSDFVTPTGRYSRKDEMPICPLEMRDFPVDILDMIIPTQAELKDKGKSDALTKLIVLIQTLWFVIQCIARSIERLPLTELEIVTLAYAMMNFFIYIFWWDKPRNVDCPVRVYKSSSSSHEAGGFVSVWEEGRIARPFHKMVNYSIGAQDQYLDLSKETSTPMFWSGRLDDPLLLNATMGPSLLGAAFGAMHCIAWNSEFPSHSELMLWRVSCMAMIIVPAVAALACLMLRLTSRKEAYDDLVGIIGMLLLFILSLSFWLYIIARIATLVIAFATLRSLPPVAFSVVDWTTFIPHI